jgi:hypothetical protein
MIGNIQSRVNQLKKIGKEMEKQTGEKAGIADILKEYGTSQGSLARMQDVGLVRATARQILINDIKAGKIKNITVEEVLAMNEPLDPFRQFYGENALEQLDSLIPDFKKLTSEIDAEKLARTKFKFEPDVNRPKESYTKEEMEKILKEKPVATDKKRQLTRDEIEDYEAELGDSETWLSEGTVEEAEKALKRRKDEYAYYYQQYKMGKLDPSPGEGTENRMKFLQKKLDEASITKDRRLINQNEIEELQELEDRFLVNPEKRTTPTKPVENEEQTKILTDFDTTNREPNALGGRAGRVQSKGLDYLMGF